ncbi:MAG: hypothetical protein M1819_006677 [Sarea resinae]|nr:MAG: hypothetical protein M1819_006677 [Sarea resinae]
MAAAQQTGLLDLEKELTCSICTEVLYQPLTLLDCLHTFCGSCLKEWFSWQGEHSSSRHPYTCPSCRASVRETRPDAKVTTLLDMFLQANPGRGKSEEEKEEIKVKYTPGENVVPRIEHRRRSSSRSDREDRRLIEEVRELSLRDVEANSAGPRDNTLRVAGIRESRESENQRRRRNHESRHRHRNSSHLSSTSRGDEASRSPSRQRSRSRQVGHQSSLRSLLSTDLDSEETVEEIMRQISEEGLLDGIDFSNLDGAQEDELSEKIAEAYRRRHPRPSTRTGESQSDSGESRPRSRRREEEQPRQRHHARSHSAAIQPSQPRQPSASRTHLLPEEPGTRARRQRASSDVRRQHSPPPSALGTTSNTGRAAARSATDLSDRPQSSHAQHSRSQRPTDRNRSTTDPENRSVRGLWQGGPLFPRATGNSSPRSSTPSTNDRPPARSSPTMASPQVTENQETVPTSTHTPPPGLASGAGSLVPPTSSNDTQTSNSRPSSSSSAARPRAVLYPEPSISCSRCNKAHIEYELHENCDKCNDGNYNLCLRCYRLGKGCLHWYGFGYAAWARYERQAPAGGYPADHAVPHTLTGQRYLRPKQGALQPAPGDDGRSLTSEDASKRLQRGVFCAICLAFANPCFWKCDLCNEGEWGFCNSCVAQGRCCTHPLLPLTHRSSPRPPRLETQQQQQQQQQQQIQQPPSSFSPNFPQDSPTKASPTAALLPPGTDIGLPSSRSLPGTFIPLTFRTKCDICKYPIQPSTTRFHCPQCTGGDYDICTPCYHKLVLSGRISGENGHRGWRRCLAGHRMVVVGFEDRGAGQRRVVVRDLVGGTTLKDEGEASAATATAAAPGGGGSGSGDDRDAGNTAKAFSSTWTWQDGPGGEKKSRSIGGGGGGGGGAVSQSPTTTTTTSNTRKPFFPPDGGVGMRVVALWSYYPAPGVADELMFPKGAEVREVEDINGDWFWGAYAGAKGLFPGGYVRVIG